MKIIKKHVSNVAAFHFTSLIFRTKRTLERRFYLKETKLRNLPLKLTKAGLGKYFIN